MDKNIAEKQLRGTWTRDASGRWVEDEVCIEIRRLLNERLERVATDNWIELYRDRIDGQYWELSYPESYHHGGGPPMLTMLEPEEAIRKYGVP
jgi:hypothetical protein